MMTEWSIETLAEDALIVHFGDRIDEATNARVQAAAEALRAARLRAVTDIAPAYASVLLRFDPLVARETLVKAVAMALGSRLHRDHEHAPAATRMARIVDIPVCYGGDYGEDLVAVAQQAGLAREEVIARHAEREYTVAMLGFAPGFPYLLGLDPALHVPRRANPRTRVPAGSVAIGGAQTGVYPSGLPGGWNLIGRTPLRLFDARRDPPALLAPGDRVRFRAIDAGEFGRSAGPAT